MHRKHPLSTLLLTLALLTGVSCARQFSVAVNNRTVYDPRPGLPAVVLADPALQACLNLALRQPAATAAGELLALSCARSGVADLEGVGSLQALRFLDLADNQISDLSPLTSLTQLSGLNLPNNRLTDIAPLLRMPGLSAVVLTGNPQIPCAQLTTLRQRLGDSLSAPASCRP
ncbi:MAG: hypothetical protein RLZZ385_1124 [Pseudomonadota bacterium]|jgi:Leucine-rich repeat (LRR) protein